MLADCVGRVPAPSPRADPAYYRTHDPVAYVPGDAQSVISHAKSTFPLGGGVAKGKTYTGYASSVISQQPMSVSGAGAPASEAGSMAPSQPGRVTYNQFDRLPEQAGNGLGMGLGLGAGIGRRRLSIGSVAQSDAPTASMYAYGYKAGDDDAQSIAPSQAGMTEY